MAVRRFSHIAIRVSDLERSRRFYREALEFRELSELEIQGGPTARWLEMPDLGLHAVFLERDGTQVELQELDLPKPDERAGYNTIGLAHIGLRVDDVRDIVAVRMSSAINSGDWFTFSQGPITRPPRPHDIEILKDNPQGIECRVTHPAAGVGKVRRELLPDRA